MSPSGGPGLGAPDRPYGQLDSSPLADALAAVSKYGFRLVDGYAGRPYKLELELAGVNPNSVLLMRRGHTLAAHWIGRLGEGREETVTLPPDAEMAGTKASVSLGLLRVEVPVVKEDDSVVVNVEIEST